MSDENRLDLDKDTSTDEVETLEQNSVTEEEYIFCSKCGIKNSSTSKFCSSCGNNLKNIEDNIRETTQNIKSAINNNETYKNLVGINSSSSHKASWDNKDMVDFIQKNPEYYIPKFEQMQEYEKSTSWNWASFFILPLWLLYRKMYAYGFGVMVASFILSYIPFIGFISAFAIPILGGLFGNSLYLKHVEKNLGEISNINEEARHRVIISKGGVNLVLPIVMLVVTSILASIVGIIGAIAMFGYY
ncbi:MAG: zinc-ribbon domain-containing protein [Peptostreptococcaceae bacterium]